MSEDSNLVRKVYDLYSFDPAYDLEPSGPRQEFASYAETVESDKHSRSLNQDEEDDVENLDLTFEEPYPKQHLPEIGPGMSRKQQQMSDSQIKLPPVLGTSLSQRKELLRQRLKELTADIRKREKLEQQMLEKADIETTGLELLLGNVKDFSPGSYPSVDGRRTSLEREIITLKKAGWDEQLRCWRDLVALKKELREALEEYHLICSAEGLSQAGD